MRFTNCICMPQNISRLRDASWQRWRKRKIIDDGLAEKLTASGLEVIDANEYVRKYSPLYHADYKSLSDVEPIHPQPPKLDFTHPLWKERTAKVLDGKTFPMAGVKQAQVLTNSVVVNKIPNSIMELSKSNQIVELDDLVQNVIRQSYLWDAHLDKQPYLRSLDIPVFKYKLNYAVATQTANKLLIRNLFRLCESTFPQEVSRTLLAGTTDLRLNVEREGFPVQFRLSPLASILSKQPLPLIVPNTEEIVASGIPDISPLNSVVNFDEENIYDSEDFIGFKLESPFPHIHTSCFSHEIPGSFTHVHPRWNSDRFAACTLLYGFTTAVLMARRTFGQEVSVLPKPITTQTIHFTGKEWQFGIFELNTLNLEDSVRSNLRNKAWLSDRIPLFENCRYDLRQGRALFDGYNPEVFKLLYAFYAASTTEPLPQPPPTAQTTLSHNETLSSVPS